MGFIKKGIMGFVTPDYGTIFWMVIAFGIALTILRKFAWKPILNALKDREESISEALSSADKARKEVADLKANNKKVIAEARKEKEVILKEAKELKDKMLVEAKDEATKEGQKIIEAAHQQIESEKEAAISEIRLQITELSVLVAEKIIQKELEDKKTQEETVNNILKDLKMK